MKISRLSLLNLSLVHSQKRRLNVYKITSLHLFIIERESFLLPIIVNSLTQFIVAKTTFKNLFTQL